MVGGRPLSKKIVFASVMMVTLGVAIEVLAYLGGVAVVGKTFSLPRLQQQRDALVASAGISTLKANSRWVQEEILHPYVGFTSVPITTGKPFGLGGAWGSAPPTRGADRVIIAFVGGSFAQLFFDQGAPQLLARLNELPRFRGKTLVPVNLTMAGYKQPQQVMTVAYLLSLGAGFDIVVNIDGFNDVAIHPTENAPARVFPAYPRRWHQRMEGVLHGGALRLMVLRVQLEQRRAALAEAFATSPWRHLYSANLVYAIVDRDLERRLGDTDMKLLGADRAATASAVATGPEMSFASDAEMFAHLVQLWQRGSRLLDGIAVGTDARYYHFLQPNQYFTGSKPLSSEERATAWQATHPYRGVVEAAYPMLRQAGRALAAEGVRFTDLTGAFAGHSEPLYIDPCCHVGPRGNAILAELIFEDLRRDFEQDVAARRAPTPRSVPAR